MGVARETFRVPYSPLELKVLTFTGWNENGHVVIGINTDLSGFVVTMHSLLCEQYALRIGLPVSPAPPCTVTTNTIRTGVNPWNTTPDDMTYDKHWTYELQTDRSARSKATPQWLDYSLPEPPFLPPWSQTSEKDTCGYMCMCVYVLVSKSALVSIDKINIEIKRNIFRSFPSIAIWIRVVLMQLETFTIYFYCMYRKLYRHREPTRLYTRAIYEIQCDNRYITNMQWY